MSRALRQTWSLGTRAFEAALRAVDGRVVGTITEGEESVELDAAATRLGDYGVRLDLDGRTVRARVFRDGDTTWVCIGGRTVALARVELGARAAAHGGDDDFAVSPMTGTLAKVSVAPGDEVAQGGELFIVEAMKMEYVVKAPRDVTVVEVRAEAGVQVDQGAVIVTFVEEEADA